MDDHRSWGNAEFWTKLMDIMLWPAVPQHHSILVDGLKLGGSWSVVDGELKLRKRLSATCTLLNLQRAYHPGVHTKRSLCITTERIWNSKWEMVTCQVRASAAKWIQANEQTRTQLPRTSNKQMWTHRHLVLLFAKSFQLLGTRMNWGTDIQAKVFSPK